MLVKCKRTRDKESGTIRLEMYRVISCKSFSYLLLSPPLPFLSSNKLSLNFIFRRIPTKRKPTTIFPSDYLHWAYIFVFFHRARKARFKRCTNFKIRRDK